MTNTKLAQTPEVQAAINLLRSRQAIGAFNSVTVGRWIIFRDHLGYDGHLPKNQMAALSGRFGYFSAPADDKSKTFEEFAKNCVKIADEPLDDIPF